MNELYAHRSSPIHRIDARVKAVHTLAFIVFLTLTPNRAWPAYVLFLTVSLSIALLSRLGIAFVLKRSLLAVPFLLAAAPLTFTGPPPLSVVGFGEGFSLNYSPEGFARFVSIAIRAWISVQAAILLAATTRFPDLLLALQQLRVPKLFVAIAGLMWRYLWVMGDEAGRLLRARACRSAASAGGGHAGGRLYWRARVAGGMAGSLFLRSMERGDRVYAAMLSRGFNGELPTTDAVPLSTTDRFVLLLGFGLLAPLWLLGVVTGG